MDKEVIDGKNKKVNDSNNKQEINKEIVINPLKQKIDIGLSLEIACRIGEYLEGQSNLYNKPKK